MVRSGLGWTGKLNTFWRTFSLNHNEPNSSRVKALAQLEKLHQLVAALRERVESDHTLVDVQMIGRLSDALERLSSALKSVQ